LSQAAADLSVGENTYRRIRHGIVFGELRPGEKLRLDRLRQHYQTSVSTLRELLSRLSAEGLVHAEGQRGFEVAPVSAKDLREVADMRQFIECHALEQSFAAGDLEWEGRVVAAHHKLQRVEQRLMAGETAESSVWKRYDWEFHHALVSACGSAELMDVHANIYDRYLRYQMVVGIFRGEIAAKEHRTLLDCALERDAGEARRVLAVHIQACVDAIIARHALP